MRISAKSIMSLLVAMIATSVHCTVVMGDDARTTAETVRSTPVSLGEGDYVLYAHNGRDLVLQHTQKGKVTEWGVIPSQVKMDGAPSEHRWPSSADEGRITQISLVRWSHPSLLAVARVSTAQTTVFWCLEFKHLVRTLEGERRFVSKAVAFTQGGPRDRVLAVSCAANSPAITIVTGRLSEATPNRIEQGMIMFEWCGFPEAGQIGEFTPRYPSHSKP